MLYCDKCSMLDAHSSGHLVHSHSGLGSALLVETESFSKACCDFHDFAIKAHHGTFSILH